MGVGREFSIAGSRREKHILHKRKEAPSGEWIDTQRDRNMKQAIDEAIGRS